MPRPAQHRAVTEARVSLWRSSRHRSNQDNPLRGAAYLGDGRVYTGQWVRRASPMLVRSASRGAREPLESAAPRRLVLELSISSRAGGNRWGHAPTSS